MPTLIYVTQFPKVSLSCVKSNYKLCHVWIVTTKLNTLKPGKSRWPYTIGLYSKVINIVLEAVKHLGGELDEEGIWRM